MSASERAGKDRKRARIAASTHSSPFSLRSFTTLTFGGSSHRAKTCTKQRAGRAQCSSWYHCCSNQKKPEPMSPISFSASLAAARVLFRVALPHHPHVLWCSSRNSLEAVCNFRRRVDSEASDGSDDADLDALTLSPSQSSSKAKGAMTSRRSALRSRTEQSENRTSRSDRTSSPLLPSDRASPNPGDANLAPPRRSQTSPVPSASCLLARPQAAGSRPRACLGIPHRDRSRASSSFGASRTSLSGE